ncbi:MAG: hypothetical protein NZ749_07880 [bacterium]|nr:hypothetical protein [bacterium]
MERHSPFDTLLVCGVLVVQWRGAVNRMALQHCQQILQALARTGYREVVLDLRQAIVEAPREWQRLLGDMEKVLPLRVRVELVLPADSPPVRHSGRIRVAPSMALALSHITRLPVASLQATMTTHVRWQEVRDEE